MPSPPAGVLSGHSTPTHFSPPAAPAAASTEPGDFALPDPSVPVDGTNGEDPTPCLATHSLPIGGALVPAEDEEMVPVTLNKRPLQEPEAQGEESKSKQTRRKIEEMVSKAAMEAMSVPAIPLLDSGQHCG